MRLRPADSGSTLRCTVHAENAFYGPFVASPRAPTVLVVGTTYDPATPYRAAVRMTAEMGNATLLTMQGDGHTAYGGRSGCIDLAVTGEGPPVTGRWKRARPAGNTHTWERCALRKGRYEAADLPAWRASGEQGGDRQ